MAPLSRRFVWIILTWMLLSQAGFAVQLNIRHYDTRDGLPQVQVLTVHQCDQGYLWLGTYSGLSRYDGERFHHYRTPDGLTSNYITRLAADGQGGLWIGTGSGLCRLADNEIDCLKDEALGSSHVHALLVQDARVWVATDIGLFRVHDREVEAIPLPTQARGQPVVYSLALDRDERLWVGGTGRVYRQADQFTAVSLPGPVANRKVMSMVQGTNELWIGTNFGLYRYREGTINIVSEPAWLAELDIATLLFTSKGTLLAGTASGLLAVSNGNYTLWTTANRLASNIHNELFVDREGLTWLAHDLGLSKLLPGPFYGYTVDSGLAASFVRTIGQDPQGRLWLGTRAGAQIVQTTNGRWRIDQARTIGLADGLTDKRIYSIAFPAPDEALLATSHGLVRWRDSEGVVEVLAEEHGLPSNRVRSLLIDSTGRTWISTDLGTVIKVNGRISTIDDPQLAAAYAMRIREDDEFRLWFATIQQGLIVLHPDGRTEHWDASRGMSSEMLWDAAPATDGSVWVGSNGDGLFQVWPDGRLQRWTSADGLADDFVWQVLIDRQQRVWAYTNRGLSRFDGERFVNYQESDGLLHLEGAATAAFESSDGQLWFASANGLMRYDPDAEHHNQVPPAVRVEEVRAGDQPVQQGMTLPYRPGTLRIRFAGLTFHDEQSTLFRYRLKGADTDWQETDTSRSVTYASLGSGRYRFEVHARNPHGIWSEEPASFEFRVRPAPWQTWWFWLVALVGIAALIRAGVRLRLRQTEFRRRELEAIITERTRELRKVNQLLHEAARSDQLTGLPNRRYLLDRIGRDIAQSRRAYADHGSPVNRDIIFMMIDLDDFKQINDRYGHDVGDRILVAQSQLISRQLRETDDLVRWGGEEFLVVARLAEASLSPVLAERIVQAARNHSHALDETGESISCTCSIGIACFPFDPANPRALDWEQVVQVADLAVYRAKAMGRDGWLWVRPGQGKSIIDPDQFVRSLRGDFTGAAESGLIEVKSSFEPAGCAPQGTKT